MLTRRRLLREAGWLGAVGAFMPGRLALGAAPTENRLAFLILRGGLDGLTAVPPYADPNYVSARPHIAVPRPGVEGGALDLNGYFGLHPSLAPLHPLYGDKQLLIVQAVTTSYRARSHFDGQNLLENGTDKPYGAVDGWLNRALARVNDGDRRLGLSVGHAVPLLMRGDQPVRTWAPSSLPSVDDDFMARLRYAYAEDTLLSAALRQGSKSQADAAGVMDGMPLQRGPRGQYKLLAEAAGRLLAEPNGPRIAVLEAGGWDTHVNQANRLRNLLRDLTDGLTTFRAALGSAWGQTAVVVISEFGRTVAENGSRGTDHGVGGIALLLGGAVSGGRISGTWPGLAERNLYENRDVMPTSDYRGIFKAVLHDHIGIDMGFLEDTVFPRSRAAKPMDGIIKRG